MNVSTAKKYIAHFWTVFLFLLLPVLWKTIKAQSDSASKTEFKPSWLGMPVAFYTPETRWAGGATGLFNFKLSKDSVTRTSQVALYGVYTQEDQIILRLPIGIFTPDNRFWIRNDFEIYHYPYKFWGVGNDTPDDAEEAFTPEYFRNELVIMKRFFKHLFLGMQFEYMNYKMDKFEKGGLIDRKAVYGADGGTTFGFGLALRLDSRDNIFAPTCGHYHEIQSYTFLRALGSDYEFTFLNFIFRKYYSMDNRTVFAVQGYAEMNFGEAPFYRTGRLGGDSYMRGYFKGRYRDRNYLFGQLELRRLLFWRVGGSVFGALGDVGRNFSDFRLNNIKYSYGGAITFLANRKEKIYLRTEFAIGKNTSGLYFTALYAF